MMMLRPTGYLLFTALGAFYCSNTLKAQTPPPPPNTALTGPGGVYEAYLPSGAIDAAAIVGAPPAPGSQRLASDKITFQKTRSLEGSPRWDLAIADGGRGAVKAFSCAAGAPLDGKVPALAKLLGRMRTDVINLTKRTTEPPEDFADGKTCIAAKPGAPIHAEYPSLQSAWGWSIAMLIAEAIPARTNELMRRGRAYGDSAMICGTASESAVLDGRAAAGALLARLRAQPTFITDYAAAKADLIAAVNAPSGEVLNCGAEESVLKGS